MSNKSIPKIVSPTSRQQAIALAEDLYGLYIEGVYFGSINDEFAPEISVEWSDSTMADLLGSVSEGGKTDGGADASAPKLKAAKEAIGGIRTGKGFGLSAKKLFEKAGYFTWSANVTLVDWDGTGVVWERWEMLKSIILPKTTTGSAFVNSTLNGGLSALSRGGNAQDVLRGAASGAVTAGVVEAIGTSGLIDEESYQGALARQTVQAPEPVHIRIGRYAQTQGSSPVASMKVFIESLGATFSKEMTVAGPMYVTFTIGFSSVEPMTYESHPVGGSRVNIIEGGE